MRMVEEKEIGGLRVTTQQLPALRAGRLFWQLGKVAPYVMARIDTSKLATSGEIGNLVPALLQLFERLSVDDAEALMRECLCCTSVVVTDDATGAKRKIDLISTEAINGAFTGRLGDMFNTIAFAVSVNFADFIGGAIEHLVDAPAAQA